MPVWLWLVDSLAIVVALAVALVVWLVVRRRILTQRAGGSFEMSTNRNAEPGPGWMIGFAVYRDAELLWYRTFSPSLRPRFRFVRGAVLIEGRRPPVGREIHAMHLGHVIVDTQNGAGVQQLAMNANALTGLLSWLESSPPGQRVNNVV